MRTNLDFSPFYRSSIGFDRIFNLLENANPPQNGDNWPPYDIVKLGEDAYRIVIAVAGFGEDELTITHESEYARDRWRQGRKRCGNISITAWLCGPLSAASSSPTMSALMAAKLENGLLIIDLKKEIPEEMKPRRIAIKADTQEASVEADRKRRSGLMFSEWPARKPRPDDGGVRCGQKSRKGE